MNKKTSIVLGALVFAIIVYLVFRNHPGPKPTQPIQNQTNNQASLSTPTPTPAPASKPATKKLSYTQAVNTYQYRFQFSQCHANPGTLSVRKGSPVMLDNRDDKPHTIKANGQTIYVKAYDYSLLYPQKTTGAKTDPNLTCDGGGSATLNVE